MNISGGGKVFTVVVDDTKSNTLMPIIANKISPDSVVYTDSYYSYNAGVPENAERFWGGNALGVSDFYHERVQHSKLFAKGKNHINDIENFWNQPKRVLYSVVNKF